MLCVPFFIDLKLMWFICSSTIHLQFEEDFINEVRNLFYLPYNLIYLGNNLIYLGDSICNDGLMVRTLGSRTFYL